MHINDHLYITLVIEDDKELSDSDYEREVDDSTQTLAKYVAEAHGPNALKIMGDAVVRCVYDIDRGPNAVSTVDIRCSVPPDMKHRDMVDLISSCWMKLPLGSAEYYVR